MCCLRKVDDPRKPSNGTLHDFVEILVIAMAAVLSDCDTVEDIIACWAQKKEGW
ncbi:MAG TPA: transposase family protein, partial [Nitrospira sp.]|nr:transposase family protein [Nitrospira sp.]